MNSDCDDKLVFLKNIALQAGDILIDLFRGNFEIESKTGAELLTTADKKSEEFIIDSIRKEYSGVEIVAEETNPKKGDEKEAFIIDPLDGTNNFSFGIPMFCVSIAYQINNDLKIGVVYDPVHKELFYAEKGKKAYLNDVPISVSKRKNLKDSIVATGFPYIKEKVEDSNIPEFSAMLMKSRGLRRLGSAALDLCYVACGRFDGYWEKHLKVWDISAGGVIVAEAGGKISNFYGDNWNYKLDNVIASNGIIHSEIQEVIKRL
jgi:myo-inositol-1(or 4)-monophosphatase